MTIIKFPNIKKVEYDSDAFLDSFLDVCKRVQELDKLLQTNWIDQNLEYKIGGLLNMVKHCHNQCILFYEKYYD